jgi:hypothetical protein
MLAVDENFTPVFKFFNCPVHVQVPVDSVLGKRGTGFQIAQERLGPGRIFHCMRWLGTASNLNSFVPWTRLAQRVVMYSHLPFLLLITGQSQRAFDLMCNRMLDREVS